MPLSSLLKKQGCEFWILYLDLYKKMSLPCDHAGCPSPDFGGYVLPSTSRVGLQVHLSPSGIESITEGMWLPQPHQVDFSVVDHVSSGKPNALLPGV